MSREDNGQAIRFSVLDAYRYVAAVGVFLYHLAKIDPVIRAPFVGAYGLFVDMFFILSGFVMLYTYGDSIRDPGSYWSFQARRLARVYPLHLVMVLVFVVYTLATTANVPALRLAWDAALQLTLTHAWGLTDVLALNQPSWSISAEFACYLLFPLLVLAISRLPIMLAFGLIAACYLGLGHAHLPIWHNPSSQVWGANVDHGWLRALAGFLNGLALCRLYRAIHWSRKYLMWIGLILLAGATIGMCRYVKPEIVVFLFSAAILTTALGERGYSGRAPMAAALEWFGDTSYAVYMIHAFLILAVFEPLWFRLALAPGNFPLFALGSVALLTLLGRVTFVWFEAPARRRVTAALVSRPIPQGAAAPHTT